jgi:hypothetical protein
MAVLIARHAATQHAHGNKLVLGFPEARISLKLYKFTFIGCVMNIKSLGSVIRERRVALGLTQAG